MYDRVLEMVCGDDDDDLRERKKMRESVMNRRKKVILFLQHVVVSGFCNLVFLEGEG